MRREEPQDPKKALVKGLGLLWRAARSAASGIRKEVKGTDWAKTIDDAGREVVRATTNVVNRIESELRKVQNDVGSWERSDADPNRTPPPDPNKPKGPTPDDPGFSIADEDESKKSD